MEGRAVRTASGTIEFDDLPRRYEDLVRLHAPRPIRDKVELENATELIDLMAGHDLTADQEDYLDLLSDLVAKYEEATSPIGRRAAPIKVLRWLVEEHEMKVTELGELLGDRSVGSRVLSGQRALSKTHIRILSAHFKISPAAFI